MVVKVLKMQISSMLRKKETVLTFFIVMAFMFFIFYYNMCLNYKVGNISQMRDFVKMLTLSDWTISGYFFTNFLPLLVVIPTACSYIADRDTRIKLYMEARCGKRTYWYSKLLSVFIVTFLIFTIPFLIEIIMSAICFNISSNGDPSLFGYYQTIENDANYELASLYINNKILYAIVMTLIFGIICGILATFNFAVTTIPIFRFRIFTFFPIYILLYVIIFIERVAKPDFTINYMLIIRMFASGSRNYMVYGIFLVALIIASLSMINIKIRRDEIL